MPRTGGAIASVRGCQGPVEGWLLRHRVSFWSGESVLGLNGVMFAHHLLKTTRMCWISPQARCVLSRSVISDSLRPHGLQPARLLCPWDSPGKNTGVGCHFLLQGTFLTQGSNPRLLQFLHWQILYHIWEVHVTYMLFFLKIGQSVFPGQTCKMQVCILFKMQRLKWGHDLLISVLGLMSRRDVSLVTAFPGHRSQMPRPPRPCKLFFSPSGWPFIFLKNQKTRLSYFLLCPSFSLTEQATKISGEGGCIIFVD